jgi:hypothetical protein
VFGLSVMKWMVRRIARRASRIVFYCHPHEFVHAHHQSFPRNMSQWNMQGMTPDNFSILDGFVEHMLLQGYSSTLFAGSFSEAPAASNFGPSSKGEFAPISN